VTSYESPGRQGADTPKAIQSTRPPAAGICLAHGSTSREELVMEILIVGGGYIGMYTARQLERLLRPGEATVTVVDPRGYMTYQPLLAEAAGGSVEPRHVIAPLPRVLRHTRLLTGTILGIDHRGRLAVFAPTDGPERVLQYDVLVMAAGSVSRVLPVEGLADYGAGFKTVPESVHLRNHVLSQLAVAASASDPAIAAAALTFVVVGGGFAGVEALAELQGLADEAVRFHPALEAAGLRWVLVEATGRILPELDQRLGQWTLRALRRRGVDVRLHTRLAAAARGTVLLDDGTELAVGTLVCGRPGCGPARWARRLGCLPIRPAGYWLARTCPSPACLACSPPGTSRPCPRPDPARRVLPAQRAARGPPGQGTGPQHRRLRPRRPAQAVPARLRRVSRRARPPPGRGAGVPAPAHRLRRLAGAPRLPPALGANPQPQGASAHRLDPSPDLPPRHCRAGLPGTSRRRLPKRLPRRPSLTDDDPAPRQRSTVSNLRWPSGVSSLCRSPRPLGTDPAAQVL
jgi:hypothetical protein